MTDQILTATIERAADGSSLMNLETGEFPMILATQGETSDGHILNIAGVSSAGKVPLQIDHSDSALRTLGSITNIRATRRGSMPVLKAIGRIELDGEGEQAAIRRDVAFMISSGHLSAISIRASGEKVIARQDLPTTHPAHVSGGEKNMAKRFGMLFERSTLREGSIVAMGADKRAIIGRSDLAENVTDFWTTFLDVERTDTEVRTDEDGNVHTMSVWDTKLSDERTVELEIGDEVEVVHSDDSLQSGIDRIQTRVYREEITRLQEELEKAGKVMDGAAIKSILDLHKSLTKQLDTTQVTNIRSLEGFLRDAGASRTEAKRIIALCKGNTPPRDAEVTRKPTPSYTVREVQTLLSEELAGLKAEITRACSDLLKDTLGKKL